MIECFHGCRVDKFRKQRFDHPRDERSVKGEEEQHMSRARRLSIASLAVITVLVAACGTQSSSSGKPSKGGVLTIDNESGTLWSCGFNPFNGNVNWLVFGPVYEPLVYVNLLSGKQTPMLARRRSSLIASVTSLFSSAFFC